MIEGNHYVSYCDHNQIYDPQTESWFFAAQMPTGRSTLALVNVDDVLYALGGKNRTVYGLSVPGNASEEEWEAAYDIIASCQSHANERYFPVGYSLNPGIPEFPSWTILPLLLLAIAVVIVYRKKLYMMQTNT